MNEIEIRPANVKDFPTIVNLNLAAIKATAEMDLAHLKNLHHWSEYHKVATYKNQVVAFLLVIPPGKSYPSQNYQWFNDQYDSFLYVDRIVVDEHYIGMKIGTALYHDLFSVARKLGVKNITCEYNIKPLNTTSKIFHQRHGFKEVATQWLDSKSKQVSLQVAQV